MRIETATPVLRVSDYQRAKAFWTEILGFDCVEEAGEPAPGFGIFRQGGARVFLEAWQGPEAPYHRWRAYFHVDGLEDYFAGITARGGTPSHPLTTTEYGMREFEITDPDGNVVCFGTDA